MVEEVVSASRAATSRDMGRVPPAQFQSIDQEAESSELSSSRYSRLRTGIGELDRVLGGGLVPDSFTLLGGDPGIGKSTLLLQMASGLAKNNPEIRIFYASGEESVDQIRDRARRLNADYRTDPIDLASETEIERVLAACEEAKPQVLLVDSLQTFVSGSLESAPGSVSQVREIASRLMHLAKSKKIAVWLVGHVTKEGNIAGPKTVEHMVDTVLYFEGEGAVQYRMLRAVKNRFGSSRELGLFEMEGDGLREVKNPSQLFLCERLEPVPGVAIASTIEGTRPILVELQALVSDSVLAVPRRTSVGLDSSRLALLSAIVERHLKLKLAEKDLFFNVAGGLRINEPACDLAAVAAIYSSHEEIAWSGDTLFLGEVGLTGEVRPVAQLDQRFEEARKLGFKTVVIPERTPKSVLDRIEKENARVKEKMKTFRIASVAELAKLSGARRS